MRELNKIHSSTPYRSNRRARPSNFLVRLFQQARLRHSAIFRRSTPIRAQHDRTKTSLITQPIPRPSPLSTTNAIIDWRASDEKDEIHTKGLLQQVQTNPNSLHQTGTTDTTISPASTPKNLENRLLDYSKSLDAHTFLAFVREETLTAYSDHIVQNWDLQRIHEVNKLYDEPKQVFADALMKNGRSKREAHTYAKNIVEPALQTPRFQEQHQLWHKQKSNLLLAAAQKGKRSVALEATKTLYGSYISAAYETYLEGDTTGSRDKFWNHLLAADLSQTEDQVQFYLDYVTDALVKTAKQEGSQAVKTKLAQINSQQTLAKENISSLYTSWTCPKEVQKLLEQIDLIELLNTRLAQQPRAAAMPLAFLALQEYALIQKAETRQNINEDPFQASRSLLALSEDRIKLSLQTLGLSKKEVAQAMALADLEQVRNEIAAYAPNNIAIVGPLLKHTSIARQESIDTEHRFVDNLDQLMNVKKEILEVSKRCSEKEIPFGFDREKLREQLNQIEESSQVFHEFIKQINGDAKSIPSVLASPLGARYFDAIAKLTVAYWQNQPEQTDDRAKEIWTSVGNSLKDGKKEDFQNSQSLDKILITPVQRGPRWPLLMKEMAKQDPRYQQAAVFVKDCCKLSNERVALGQATGLWELPEEEFQNLLNQINVDL